MDKDTVVRLNLDFDHGTEINVSKYPFLDFFIKAHKALAWGILIISVIVGLCTAPIGLILTFGVAPIVFLVLLTCAEVMQVVCDIEKNTRK